MMIDVDLLLTYGATYKKISKGEIIFTEGDNCSFYYQLLTGRVNWLNINDDGNEFIQMLIYPGESFGELPLFDNEPYGESAIADEDSVKYRYLKAFGNESAIRLSHRIDSLYNVDSGNFWNMVVKEEKQLKLMTDSVRLTAPKSGKSKLKKRN